MGMCQGDEVHSIVQVFSYPTVGIVDVFSSWTATLKECLLDVDSLHHSEFEGCLSTVIL